MPVFPHLFCDGKRPLDHKETEDLILADNHKTGITITLKPMKHKDVIFRCLKLG